MKPAIIPVIHYEDDRQVMRNAERAFDTGCDGVLLIHMEGRDSLLLKPASAIKAQWCDKLVGLNMLNTEPSIAVKLSLSLGLDMTWTDHQLTHSDDAPWTEAGLVEQSLAKSKGHLLFCGVAFKHQAHEPHPASAATRAVGFGFVPTTSGSATGVAAEPNYIANLRDALSDTAPLAIASGITPQNAAAFAPHLSHILVSTGVSSSFHEFDSDRLTALRQACEDAA